MVLVRQFYGGDGVPMAVPGRPEEIAAAWRSHRQRLRGWFGALDDDRWSGPTRCTEWSVRDLAQHLISGAQFLGYTLHQSKKGEATRLLEGFDPQLTPRLTAAQFAGLSPQDLIDQLEAIDERVDAELDALADAGWTAPAEAPLGKVPAYVSVNHFLFDSWVHERDLMLPAGEVPLVDLNEAATVASYVVALAGVGPAVDDGTPTRSTLTVHLTDLDRHLHVEVSGGRVEVSYSAPTAEPDVAGTAADLVDLATGRSIGSGLVADSAATAFLGRLATAMA